MTAKPVMGRGGKVLGYEQDNGSEIVLLANGGKVLGRFLKSSNQTVDAGGKLIGFGNLLYTLLSD